MFYNYTFKRILWQLSSLGEKPQNGKPAWKGFSKVALLLLFAISGMKAQTTLINPATDGGFNSGNTFTANGWTVANQGTGKINWVVGNAVSSGAITGNSAYVSIDGGESNSSVGFSGSRTVYFYKDVAIPAGQTNIALSFNWKAIGTSWQVFVAPTSVTPVGTDVLTSVPATIAGATSITYNSATGTGVTQNAFGFIPPSFAGTTARLIFMWSSSGSGTNPPAAIDNISLVSRIGGAEIASVGTGNFTNPATWDAGYVPSAADDIVINAGHTVTIDARNLGANNLYIAGANAIVQFGTLSDEFTVYNDVLVSGSGARLNVYETTNGKSLKVGHDISLGSGGRLDVSVGSTTANAGALTLFGSSLQTISSDGTGLIGGVVAAAGTTNTTGILNQLVVSNTSPATPNIDWQLNNIRIKSILRLNSGRVALGSNKIILGNYAIMSSTNFTCNLGSGFIGGTIARWYGTGATGVIIDPGIDYNPTTAALFPSLSTTGKNRWAFIYASNTSTAGELAMTYADANTINTGLSIADGAYTITNRYNGNWSVSTAGSTYASTAGTFSLGLYATSAYATNDGSSRILNAAAAAPGLHVNGTTTPFASRSGLTVANLTAGAFYVGSSASSVLASATKTSAASGDWNTAGTWSPSGVPTCSDIVTIASGHTVTVNGFANAAGVTVNGTLVNAGGTMTVGCTNNNAIFTNNGTHTVSGGTLAVNGGVYQKFGSTFNQSGGNIIVDSNAAGVAANSVGQGGSSFKIDTANLNLTGGKITIVDPLVNNTVATTATSATNYTMSTLGATGTFAAATSGVTNAGSTSVLISTLSGGPIYGPGQLVSGAGIAPGTTVTAMTVPLVGFSLTLTLSQPVTAAIPASTALTFSSMANGCSVVNFSNNTATNANWANVAVGQSVSGAGIQAGTKVASIAGGIDGNAAVYLTLPVSGLGTSPITSAQTLTFSAAASGSAAIILSAANPAILVGQTVGGAGIPSATTVTAISGNRIDLSQALTGTVSLPLTLNFYDGNLNSYAFAYNSPVNYAAGLQHTLQIGDGTSTDKAAVTTNGYLCNMVQGGGTLSLGNLVVNAPDGANRFMNAVNTLNVQNAFVVAPGSTFKRTNTTGALYFGGNIINNGSAYVGTSTVNLANYINAVAVPTALPQTITGTGAFYNNLNTTAVTGAVSGMTVNNTSTQGVTLNVPNFRVTSVLTMTAGIIHTSAATPLYHGVLDLSIGSVTTGNFSDACFIDGPYSKTVATNSNSTIYQLYPVGKGSSYMPISMAASGGASFTAEAFATNTGTASANIANVSAARWKVGRDGAIGALTDFNVKLGQSGIAANNIVAQASTDQGTYDNVLGSASVFTSGTPNTINTVAAIAGANFTGNFAYATLPNCGTVNPGNTIADLTVNKIITTQNTTATGMVTGSTAITLAATNALITTGLTVTGTGIPAGTTVTAVSGVSVTLSQAATTTVTSQTTLTFTAVETPTALCGSQPVRLSLQNTIAGNGVVYQWQSSANGTTYADVAGATSATYSATPAAATYYRCKVTCPYGPVTATSTPVQVNFSNNVTATTPASRCDAGTLTLAATAASGTINWYAAATGGTALATGATFTTPSLSAPATYYAAAESTSTYTAGRALAGTLTQTAPYSGIVFNASTNVRLNSVKIYPKQTAGAIDAGAPMTIKLFKDGVQVPGTAAVTFTPVTNTATVASTSFNVVTLNYDIPAGTGYKLLITSGLSANNTVARITSSPAATPYGVGAISVTGGVTSFDGTPDVGYYNFFDLNVTEVCASPRVAVLAKVGDLITAQPANVNICSTVGATATVSVATTATAATYAWQYRVVTTANPNPAWTTITAANAGAVYTNYATATLGITKPTAALPAKGTQYRVLVDSGCGAPLTSDIALLNALAAAKGGAIAVATNVCIGTDVTFTVSGYVGTSVQWQSSPISTAAAPGDFTDIPGATGTTYTATNLQLTSDRSYRVLVTNGPCGGTTAYSATKTITINPKSVPGTVTGGGTICSGSSGSLKVAGYVGKIQWEYSTNGVNYINAPKAADAQTIPFGTTSTSSTATSYVPTNITANVYFRAKITSGVCSSSYTSPVQYVIGTTAFAGVISPASSLICPATGTTLNLSAATGTITWQKSTNWTAATPTWGTVKNATITLATGNLAASTAYRAMVTTGACSTVYSDVAVVNVVAKPLAKTIAANVTSPSGKTALTAMCTSDASKVLTVGTGYAGAIQWQTSTTSTTTGFTDIPGATGVSYNVTVPAVGANYFRVRFTNTCGAEVIGAAVTVYYKDCTIATKVVEEEVVAKTPFAVVAYPNPYNDNFRLSLTTSSEDNVGVMVYDMTGKLVDQREIRFSDMADIQIGDRYASGIYNVIVTQGTQVKTVRVIKK